MALFFGGAPVQAVYRGSTPCRAIYLGNQLVWEPSGVDDKFNRDDEVELRTPWINETPGNTYHAGVVGRTMRMAGLPDEGLVFQTTSRFRHDLTLPDDGYVEIKPATFGMAGYRTQVYRRYDDSGSKAAGVGIDLQGSALSIVSRLNSADTIHRCKTFTAEDTIRLVQVGDVHTLYRNGTVVGTWNDSGHTAHRGAGYRSVGIRVDGGFFIHPNLSPPLRYIRAE